MTTLATLAGHIGHFGQIDQIWHHLVLGEILEEKKLKKKIFWKKILLARFFRLVDTLSTLVDTLSKLA